MEQHPIILVRYKFSRFGGAEIYLKRLMQELSKKEIPFMLLSTSTYDRNTHLIPLPSWLPSWLRIALFGRKVCAFAQENRGTLYSLERIPCPDIYRAGDGVHREWLRILRTQRGVFGRIMVYLKPLNLLYLMLERRAFTHAQKIIANSHRVKEEIIHHYAIPEERIDVIPNGLPGRLPDRTKILQTKSEMEHYYHCIERVVILYVGSGFARKGVAQLLGILSKLDPSRYVAFIVGKERKQALYEAMAHKLGISHQVVFTGARDDVERFFALGDIFLFPTHYEPSSNACLEAMAFGNALVTTRANGASEVLPQGEYVMESPEDPSVVPLLERWLGDRTLLEEVKQRHAAIAAEYTMERNVSQTLEIIRKVRADSHPAS